MKSTRLLALLCAAAFVISAGEAAHAQAVWVLTETRVNPGNGGSPAGWDLSISPGALTLQITVAPQVLFEATYPALPDRLVPAETRTLPVTISGRITGGDDTQGFRNLDIISLFNGRWDRQAVGLGQNCYDPIGAEPISCSEPATVTGDLFYTPPSFGSNDWEFSVSALNCGAACQVAYTYRMVSGPCGDATAPTCAGDCPNGQTCVDTGGAGCECIEKQCETGNCCSAGLFQSAGAECRPANGVCDAPEQCTGDSPDCPPDQFATQSTICRPAASPCDEAETCDGLMTECPADGSNGASSPPELELTFPAGESPKVFVSGWVFGARSTIQCDSGQTADISDLVSWSGTGTFSPQQGSRSRPTFEGAGANTISLSVAFAGQQAGRTYDFDAVWPFDYLAVTGVSLNPADGHGAPGDPLSAMGPLLHGSPNVTVFGLPAGRSGDWGIHFVCSGPNAWWADEGDPEVLIDGRRAPRKGDASRHCGGRGRVTVPNAGFAITSESASRRFSETSGTGSIAGRVVDAIGAGIAGIDVKALAVSGTDIFGALTDENGDYRIEGVADGDFTISFWGGNADLHTGYTSEWYDGRPERSLADPVTVAGGGEVTGVDAVLQSGASIAGAVVDDQGMAIASGFVTAFDANGLPSPAVSESDGSYRIAGLQPGQYTVRCETSDGSRSPAWHPGAATEDQAVPVDVGAGEAVGDVDCAVGPAGTISGTVLDTLGDPVEGVPVIAHGTQSGGSSIAMTGADGTYGIGGLAEDGYRVEFVGEAVGSDAQWWPGAAGIDGAELVVVVTGNDSGEVDAAFELRRCGDPTRDAATTASDALAVLQASIGLLMCESCVCDVNASGTVNATDALILMQRVVGIDTAIVCPACA